MLVFNDVCIPGTISTYKMSLSIANVYGISYAIKHTKKQKPAHIQSGILSDMNRIFEFNGFFLISSQSMKLQKQTLLQL